MPGAVEVRGLRELDRAFLEVSKDVRTGMRKELREVAEPVRSAAEELAAGGIRNIGDRWSRMRVGVTSKMVYVAPKARRRGGSPRKNLAVLLLTRALEPALAQHQEEVVHRIEGWLDGLIDKNGF